MPAGTQWQSLAADALIDDSYAQQREIVRQLVADGINGSGDGLRGLARPARRARVRGCRPS